MDKIKILNEYRTPLTTVILSTKHKSVDTEITNGQPVARINISRDLSRFIDFLNTGKVGTIIIENLPIDELVTIHNTLELVLPNYAGSEFLDSLKIVAPDTYRKLSGVSDLITSKIVPDSERAAFLG